MEQCFLCTKKYTASAAALSKIQTTQLAASRKPLEMVLQHLANSIKIKLVFHANASVCQECLQELLDYDDLMINLLARQHKLTQRLKFAVSGKCIEDNNVDIKSEEFQSIENETRDITERSTKSEEIEIDDCIDMDALLMDSTNENEDSNSNNNNNEIDDDNDNDSSNADSDDNNNDEVDDDTGKKRRIRTVQECMICDLTFKSKNELQTHTIEVHTEKQFICQICGITRRDEEYLELHMNLHEGKTENECRYCPKRFSRPVNTIRHMRKHWDKKKYQCEKCGERFSLDNMLYNHRLRHEAEENPIICSICHQSFKSRKTFNHHMTTHQENRPRHHCTLCTKSFTERYTLKVHMRTHSNADIISSKRPRINKEREPGLKETEDSVKMILDTVTAEEDQRCVICNELFENKDYLERHLQFKHDVILK